MRCSTWVERKRLSAASGLEPGSLAIAGSHPPVLPVRPVYPGADLVDVRFLSDGRAALTVSLPSRTGSVEPPARELWQLDPGPGNTLLQVVGLEERR